MAVAAAPRPRPTRYWYLDNLKVVLTALVILHHTGQPYGPTGGFWYFEDSLSFEPLGIFFRINASFFMGLFFLVSGYFMPGSFDRKGAAAFVKDRLLRLGLPLVTLFVTVIPGIMYVSYRGIRGGTLPFWSYITQIYLGGGPRPEGLVSPSWPELQFGHLWFVEHLLFYAVCYAIGRRLWRRRQAPPVGPQRPAPGDLAIVAYIAALSAVTVLIRVWYPIDRWVAFLGFIQMEPAHVAQYLSFLILGAAAYRRGWLSSFAAARGFRWLAAGVGLSLLYAGLVQAGLWWGHVPGWLDSVWECAFAVSIAIGLLTLGRERLNTESRFWQALSADAFAAYLFHVPVIVALQFAMAPIGAPALVKFLVVGVVGVVATFAVSHLIRRIPGVSRIL
ncbi:MAG TPA: acyltransferase family protein [Symbiobacteriaceae bacterium]|nr:acyltransferase family protein [Symbiobacteriaceae bacterium]